MYKAVIVVLADTETPGDLGRVVNALNATKEFTDAGDQVALIFDGAGTKWVPELSRPEHKYGDLFDSVRGSVEGACAYCAKAFGVARDVEDNGIPLVGNYDQHPSLRGHATNGYEVITY
jgi:hypothetical protein